MRRLVCTAAITLSLTACVYHVDTLFPSGTVSVDSSLLGTWVDGDSARAVVTWSRFGYRVVHTDNGGDETILFARSGDLGGRTVLETWPAYPGGDDLDSAEAAIRLLYVMVPADSGVGLWSLGVDSVKAAVADGRLKVSYLPAGEHDVILTAAAAELRAALDTHLRRPGVLEDACVKGPCSGWRRVADAAGTAPRSEP